MGVAGCWYSTDLNLYHICVQFVFVSVSTYMIDRDSGGGITGISGTVRTANTGQSAAIPSIPHLSAEYAMYSLSDRRGFYLPRQNSLQP